MSAQVASPRDETTWKATMSDSDDGEDIADRLIAHESLHMDQLEDEDEDEDDELDDEDEDEDDEDDEDEDEDDLDEMEKMSSSPSIDEDDIDFNFVYALHTFIATVEGQANAIKGDTMVLLDDSNSYWWLVRVVKDNTIGYLPAEHIETPTERLARLNKHRNIDLAATMLTDTIEKPTNPIRQAIRRRIAKSVVFAEPTYVEPSDYDYSTEEDEDESGDEIYASVQVETSAETTVEGVSEFAESAASPKDSTDLHVKPLLVKSGAGSESEQGSPITPTDRQADSSAASPATSTISSEPGSPTGTVSRSTRNSDSFFKDDDDNAQPRKITLTPNLLRDSAPADRRDERKEKKSGILSNLFKRRGGKPSASASKPSFDDRRSEARASSESIEQPQVSSEPTSPARKTGRLTKPQNRLQADKSPQIRSPVIGAEKDKTVSPPARVVVPLKSALAPTSSIAPVAPVAPTVTQPVIEPAESLRLVSTMDLSDDSDMDSEAEEEHDGVELDDGDSGLVPALVNDGSSHEEESTVSSPVTQTGAEVTRSIESAVPDSLPALTRDSDSGASQLSGSTMSEVGDSRHPTPSLSFSSLRLLQFIQQPSHVRDLLTVIHDVEHVEPAPASHPIMAGLFASETKDLDRIGRELDSLLGNWFEKRTPGVKPAGAESVRV